MRSCWPRWASGLPCGSDRRSSLAAAPSTRWRLFLFGACLAAFSVAYLYVATRVVIPWFRNGQEIHYARYFARFGNSLPEIGWNILTKPRLLFDELATPEYGHVLVGDPVARRIFVPLLARDGWPSGSPCC